MIQLGRFAIYVIFVSFIKLVLGPLADFQFIVHTNNNDVTASESGVFRIK